MLDLPDELIRSLELRAAEENRTLTDLIADVLRRGLAEKETEPRTVRNRVTLPLVHASHSPRPDEELTPERISDILLMQEVEAHNDLVQ
jgi:plasmid stability protein